MSKTVLSIVLLLASAAGEASVRFVEPLAGAQVIGPGAIEVTTDTTAVDRVEFRVDGVLAGVRREVPWRIAYDFGTSLKSRSVSAKVFSNGYRTVEEASISTAALTAGENMTVDLVEVPMRVRSARAITTADLRVHENSVEQTVREIKAGRGPAHFAFVIDRSLSMSGGRLDVALQAVDEALKLLRPGDSSSVTLFNHTVDKPRPASSLRGVVSSGGTALRDALASIPSEGRTYAIVITDGGDRNSLLTEEQALRKISGTRTVVNAVVLGESGTFLQRATRNTGGALVRTGKSGVKNEVRRIIADINSRYTLVYQSHGTRGGWRFISIAPRRAGIEVLAARKGYFAE